MTMDELKEQIARSKAQGGEGLYLTVNVKRPPRGESIRVAGFGNGYLLNAVKEADGSYRCTCVFKIATVEKNILKHEMGKKFK